MGNIISIKDCYPRNGYIGDTKPGLNITYKPKWYDNNMCWSGFANTWHYPTHYMVGLEFNHNILSCRLHWLKLQHLWLKSNIPYTALESPNEIPRLVSTDSGSIKLLFEANQSYLSFIVFCSIRLPQAH